MLKEQTRAVERAAEPLVRRLLEVLDEFDLALMAAEQQPGVRPVPARRRAGLREALDILAAEGLERIEAAGQAVRPDACTRRPDAERDDGDGEPVVADVLREGYTLRGPGHPPGRREGRARGGLTGRR